MYIRVWYSVYITVLLYTYIYMSEVCKWMAVSSFPVVKNTMYSPSLGLGLKGGWRKKTGAGKETEWKTLQWILCHRNVWSPLGIAEPAVSVAAEVHKHDIHEWYYY